MTEPKVTISTNNAFLEKGDVPIKHLEELSADHQPVENQKSP
jgi:hypothetical protein